MKKSYCLFLVLFFVAVIGYLWFGYANIYNRIGAGNLKTVDEQYIYTFNINASQELKYAALGDSLTAGIGTDSYEESFPYLIGKELSDNKKVILKDFSLLGARTEDLIKKNLLLSTIEDKPDVVMLLIGVNDVRENISEEEFKKNYEYIVNELIDNTEAKIYLISIPLIGSNTLYLPPYDWYFKNKTIKFNKIIKDIAIEHSIAYIDITSPTEQIFKKDGMYYSADSFHPSKEGYKILTKIIYDGISQ